MSTRCLGRIMRDKEENRGYFPNKKRYFLEYRCPNTSEGELCIRCSEWRKPWQERGLKKKND